MTRMASLVQAPNLDESASHIAATMPNGIVRTGSTPKSGPAISRAASTPSAQPHGTAAKAAAAVITLGGIPTRLLCRSAVSHPSFGPHNRKLDRTTTELIRDGYQEV